MNTLHQGVIDKAKVRGRDLTPWERKFIVSMCKKASDFVPSSGQAVIIERIGKKLGVIQ